MCDHLRFHQLSSSWAEVRCLSTEGLSPAQGSRDIHPSPSYVSFHYILDPSMINGTGLNAWTTSCPSQEVVHATYVYSCRFWLKRWERWEKSKWISEGSSVGGFCSKYITKTFPHLIKYITRCFSYVCVSLSVQFLTVNKVLPTLIELRDVRTGPVHIASRIQRYATWSSGFHVRFQVRSSHIR